MFKSTLLINKYINNVKEEINKLVLQLLLDYYHNKTPLSSLS